MEETAVYIRTDEDILEDVHRLIRSYQPLKMAQSHFTCRVRSGVVKVFGHVNSQLNRRLFLHNIPDIEGVMAVDDSELFDDESLRLTVAKLLPMGIRLRVNYGVVSLSGKLPAEAHVDEIKGMIAELPGIKAVVTNLID